MDRYAKDCPPAKHGDDKQLAKTTNQILAGETYAPDTFRGIPNLIEYYKTGNRQPLLVTRLCEFMLTNFKSEIPSEMIPKLEKDVRDYKKK